MAPCTPAASRAGTRAAPPPAHSPGPVPPRTLPASTRPSRPTAPSPPRSPHRRARPAPPPLRPPRPGDPGSAPGGPHAPDTPATRRPDDAPGSPVRNSRAPGTSEKGSATKRAALSSSPVEIPARQRHAADVQLPRHPHRRQSARRVQHVRRHVRDRIADRHQVRTVRLTHFVVRHVPPPPPRSRTGSAAAPPAPAQESAAPAPAGRSPRCTPTAAAPVAHRPGPAPPPSSARSSEGTSTSRLTPASDSTSISRRGSLTTASGTRTSGTPPQQRAEGLPHRVHEARGRLLRAHLPRREGVALPPSSESGSPPPGCTPSTPLGRPVEPDVYITYARPLRTTPARPGSPRDTARWPDPPRRAAHAGP